MNSVNLIGRLTKDPEVRYTSADSKAVARFTLAVDGYNDKADFISIIVFGRQAENCEKYLHKGSKAGIEGRISTGSYEKDGKKVYTTDVIATRVEFLDSKSSGSKPSEEAPSGFMASDDDVPF